MNSGAQTRAEIQQELELLKQTKKDLEIEHATLQERHEKELMAAVQLFDEVNRYAIVIKQDREKKKM